MTITRLFPRALFALCLAAAACGGSSGGPSTPTAPTPGSQDPLPTPPVTTTVTYKGLFGSGKFTGTVTLTARIPVSARTGLTSHATLIVPDASGTAKFSGASTTTVSLTGTYDTATNRFVLSGGGGGWSLDVKVVDGSATGTISTPVGDGSVAALPTTESNPASQFCGTYSGTEDGKFLVVIRNGFASGVAAQDGEPDAITLAGTVKGNSVSLSWSWTDGSGGRGLATGTIDGQTISGTWSNTLDHSGTWSGKGC